MDRPAEPGFRPPRSLSLYIAGIVAAFGLCILGGFGIGLLFLPVPIAMLVGLALWNRKWAVAGLVAAALAGSLTFVLTVPLTEFHRASVQGGVLTESGGCGRTILPDVPLKECDAASRQALVIAGISAILAGLLVGVTIRKATRTR